MMPAAKLIKDRLADLGIPRRSVAAVTGANGVAYGNPLDRKHRNIMIENADRLAAMGDLGLVIGRFDPCGCVYKAIVTTDPRHHGKVTRQELPSYGHECEEDVA